MPCPSHFQSVGGRICASWLPVVLPEAPDQNLDSGAWQCPALLLTTERQHGECCLRIPGGRGLPGFATRVPEGTCVPAAGPGGDEAWKGGTYIVQSLSHIWLFGTPWTAACQPALSFTYSQSLPRLIKLMVPSNHLILCGPFLLLLSQHQGLFQWVSSLHQMNKVLDLPLQHQSFNEYSWMPAPTKYSLGGGNWMWGENTWAGVRLLVSQR